MSRDVLGRALEAYRVESNPAQDRAAETLLRILNSRPRRRRLKPLALVAVLTCSAAAVAGVRELPRLASRFRSASARPAGAAVNPPVLEPASPEQSAPVPTVANAPAPFPSSAPHRTQRGPAALALPAAEPYSRPKRAQEAGSFDPEDVMFEQARKAHDSVSIEEDLADWDRYLSSYPDGRFAPEARYRRALALARLGRGTEALSAFLWFTDNDEGGYRREEALKWIRALSQEPYMRRLCANLVLVFLMNELPEAGD